MSKAEIVRQTKPVEEVALGLHHPPLPGERELMLARLLGFAGQLNQPSS